jgi:hypothetical protein
MKFEYPKKKVQRRSRKDEAWPSQMLTTCMHNNRVLKGGARVSGIAEIYCPFLVPEMKSD